MTTSTEALTHPPLPASPSAGGVASTPPAQAYVDPAALRAEQAAIFRSSWQVAGLAVDVASPKQFLTTEVAGVPVIVTRDRSGTLHALANVCQHRGMVLASGSGEAKALTCPNHAWTYGLDGALKAAPRTAVEDNFDCSAIRLPEYAVHEWGALVLVNLDSGAAPPTAELELVDATLREAGLDVSVMVQRGPAIDWSMQANWKIVMENYLECYHCAWVHRDFSQVFDVSAERYALTPFGELLCATSPVREGVDRDHQRSLLATDGPLLDSHWYLLFPTTTVNVYPGQGAVEMTWYWPVDPDTTGARSVVLVAPDADKDYVDQVTALLTQVGEEDIEVCESMHRGMRSGTLPTARVLPVNEALITHFHALLAERVNHADGCR